MAEPPFPSGTVTFLLTDVEGSTRIWETGGGRARVAFERHDALVAQHLASFGGSRPRDQGEGDSALAVFARASEALGCAVALQRALNSEAWPDGATIRVRMALHTGEAEFSRGNYKGSSVHRCARLRGLAHGGQIVLSEATAQIVRDQLAHDLTLRDMGVHELRGLVWPEHVYQLCHTDLPSEFPPLQSGSGRPRDLLVGHEVPLPAPLEGIGDGLFAGRAPELAKLEIGWDSPNAIGARLVLIAGEPGIGKSRLAAQFAARVYARGATVLFGRCDEEALRPYQPFAEALSTYLRAYPADQLQHRLGRITAELGRLVPELADRVPSPTEPGWSDAESERFRLFEAVATLLAELGATAPVLLVLDDLHWADKATLLLVRHLARRADLERLVLLATYRDENLSSPTPRVGPLADLDREHVTTHIRLDGLDDAGVTAMLDSTAGTTADKQTLALATTLREETEGNPFFIREVLRDLAESGAIHQQHGRWVSDAPLDHLAVPRQVRGVVAQRIARLSEHVNRVLVAAAVVGREFTFDVLEAMTGLDEETALVALDEAVHSGLIREVPEVAGVYAFSHVLVRQTFYEALTLTRRARLHHRVAVALEMLFAGDVEPHLAELGYHYCRAAGLGDTTKAVEYARRAGDRATRLFAYEDASGQYAIALQALDALSPVDETRRCDLLCALGDSAWRTSDVARARESFLEAARLARHLGDPVRLASAALGFGGGGFRPWWTENGLVDHALVELLEEALDLLDDGDTAVRVKLLGSLAEQLHLSGDVERRQRLADESVTIARRLDDPATLVQALFSWRTALWRFANVKERLAVCNEALERARALGQRELVMHALSFRLVDQMELGDIAGADADAAALEAEARELHVPFYQWATTLYDAMRAQLEGRYGDAEVLVSESFEIGQRAHQGAATHLMGAQLGILFRDQGRVEEFRAIAIAAIEQFPPNLGWRAARVMADLESGHDATVRLEFDELAADDFADVPDDFFRSITLAILAEICTRLEDGERAESLFALLLPHREQLVLLTFAVAFMGSVSHYLGMLALTRRSWDEAAEHLEDAMACHARLGAAPFLTRTRLAYVRMLVARDAPGDREKIPALRELIVEEAERLGMQAVIDEVASILR